MSSWVSKMYPLWALLTMNYLDMSGGQNSKTAPFFIKDNECELVQNYNMDNLGSLTKRDGIANVIGQTVDAKSITGMYFFQDKLGTDYSNALISVSTTIKKIKAADDTWEDSDTGLTSGTEVYFSTFVDYVFRTDGISAMESSADLTTWGTSNCLATLKPKYNCVWEDRLYALNDNSTTSYPSRIYWSELPTGTPLALTFGANNWADINPDDNDEITWGEPFGKTLLIFKKNGLYRWTFGQTEPDKLIDIGTPQGRTVKQTQGICFWANKDGVYAFDGSSYPVPISAKVKDFIEQISDLSAMRAEVDEDHYNLYIGDVTVNGISYANVMLVYTISRASWHIETYPFEIKSMARFASDTIGTTVLYDSIYLGDDDGFVYRKGTGTSDYLGTTAKTINGKIVSKEYPLSKFPQESILNKLYVFCISGIGAKVNYCIERGEWKPWKDLKSRITEGNIVGKGRTIQLSITDNSTKTSQVEGFSIEEK